MKTELNPFTRPIAPLQSENSAMTQTVRTKKELQLNPREGGSEKKQHLNELRSSRRPAIASRLVRQLTRSKSAPPKSINKLAPEFRKFDTLEHPLSSTNPLNPGTVLVARNNQDEWYRVSCTPNSLLQNIEIRPGKGLLNLTGSTRFCTGELSQTEKRDLQRAIASIVMAYNELAAESGTSPVSIHENHIKGDGNIYPNRQIPREPNEKDYDYYHTLGVNFAENGKMMPHYHLEFHGSLNRQNVEALLNSLHHVGQAALGKDILGQSEIAAVLDKLPKNNGNFAISAQMIRDRRQLLPNEIDSSKERAQRRDELESTFIALSSQNTEWASERQFIRNAHMNSFRPTEPLFECFSAGNTSVLEDLEKIEEGPNSSKDQALDISELLSIHYELNKTFKELETYTGGTLEERNEFLIRLHDGTDKIKQLLSLK